MGPSVRDSREFMHERLKNKWEKVRAHFKVFFGHVKKLELFEGEIFLDALASLEPTQVGRSVGDSFKL